MPLRTVVVLAIATVFLAASCGGGEPHAQPTLPAPSTLPGSKSSHVVTIVMENKEYGAVIGSSQAPYTNRLARRYGLATRSYGVRHPSLPNYIALTSGSTHGIDSDCTDCSVSGPSIADQMDAAHVSWKAYLEDLPRPCFTGASAGDYAKKHNPFVYYENVVRSPRCAQHVVSLDQLATDLRRRRLPSYVYIAPDLCHDTHDCSIAVGDRFLRNVVPPLLRSLGPHGFLVLTYDEGESDAACCGDPGGGRIATIVAGPDIRRGARDARPVDQYGVLATIEDALRLPRLGAARDRRHGSLRGLFRRFPGVR